MARLLVRIAPQLGGLLLFAAAGRSGRRGPRPTGTPDRGHVQQHQCVLRNDAVPAQSTKDRFLSR